ncbi:stromal processing peptidase chloroplastic [Tanacetum coccineum]
MHRLPMEGYEKLSKIIGVPENVIDVCVIHYFYNESKNSSEEVRDMFRQYTGKKVKTFTGDASGTPQSKEEKNSKEPGSSQVDNLDFVMESDALGHMVMDLKQSHESLLGVAGTITLEESEYFNILFLGELHWCISIGVHIRFWKCIYTSSAAIVACVPKKIHVDGVGEIDFKISPKEITAAIEEGLKEPIEPEAEFEVLKELITSAELDDLKLQLKPSFVSTSLDLNATKVHDKETGITQCGERAAETPETKGAVVLGVRTLSEGGRVGDFTMEQVELFCVNHLINCSFESKEEFLCMEFWFTTRDNGMRAAFYVWVEDAFDRARQLYLSYYRSIPKSLEQSTAHKLMTAMLDKDARFMEPTPYTLQNLTLQTVKDAMMNQFVNDNMEVSIVGDFSEEDIESCVMDYLGTLRPTSGAERALSYTPILFRPFPNNWSNLLPVLCTTLMFGTMCVALT